MDAAAELEKRMSRPQRHRLLQGYPMAPLMDPAERGRDPLAGLDLDPTRPMIIGVLPHTFCNPRVRGCGFCTFPHEKLSQAGMRRTLECVTREIQRAPDALRPRHVEAVYFGGGTANLTPPEDLGRLIALLHEMFPSTRAAEITLEGAPRYFVAGDKRHLDVIASASTGHRRISMGIQTFDSDYLARMGREAFATDLPELVAAAHGRGLTVSGDFLFNLPGAPLELALADMNKAIDLGLDQICAYNLVLNAELDTEWARDGQLVASMPSTKRALATWLAVRQTLLDAGYVQTTLTNFEKAPRFVYERASFDPARRDGLGFGPGAISTFTSRDKTRATKWMNAATSEAYVDQSPGTLFDYALADLRLLHLTRNIARTSIDAAQYRDWFGARPEAHFPSELGALASSGLVDATEDQIRLTPEGMFYADAVAGLLAHRRVGDRRSAHLHMG